MILTVGAGFLGSYITKQVAANSREPVLATVRDCKSAPFINNAEFIACDLTSQDDIGALSRKCDGKSLDVFYLAACHRIDYLFENPEEAKEINLTALKHFLDAMPNIRRLIFASTDCVYGEDKGTRLKETAPLNPVNEYGRQKIQAEKIVTEKGFTVARLPFMLGPSLGSKKHFYDLVCDNLASGKETEMIDGMRRNVLSYNDAAKLLVSLMDCKEESAQIINVCGDKAYTKYEIGLILAKNRKADCALIKKISETEGLKFFKDQRASSTVMDNSLLKETLHLRKISWEEDECL